MPDTMNPYNKNYLFLGTGNWHSNSGRRNHQAEESDKQFVCQAHRDGVIEDWAEYGAWSLYESWTGASIWTYRQSAC